jgi:hypothetical protein
LDLIRIRQQKANVRRLVHVGNLTTNPSSPQRFDDDAGRHLIFAALPPTARGCVRRAATAPDAPIPSSSRTRSMTIVVARRDGPGGGALIGQVKRRFCAARIEIVVAGEPFDRSRRRTRSRSCIRRR